ncbi:MAG: TIGR04283 family arsenosugar biosynthesis glycosyltransferase [Balneolaceae bacterium]
MISIIIPTYNEEKNIGELLNYLKKYVENENAELLVVDGGSSDSTIQAAESLGARVIISAQKGRAKQMNFGAKMASGEWLYFLHADTFPPPTFLDDIRQKTARGFGCGCFRLRFNNLHPALRFYGWFTRFDIGIFRFGDQSLFVKKALFWKVGGFNENLLVMEDQEIITRLKKRAQFCIIKKEVVTSARKYGEIGVFKLQLIFAIIVLLYYMQVSQNVLAHFYKKISAGSEY